MKMTGHDGSNANAPPGSQLAPSQTKVIINDSSVEISVGGHKLTLDSGKVKHASLVLSE